MPTAIELATGREAPVSLGLLTQVVTAVPLFNAFDARTSPNTRFSTLAVVALPSSGFITLGDGFKFSKGRLEPRMFDCAYIGALVKAQLDVARRWLVEHPNIGYDYFGLQAALRLQADLMHIEKQMIYGTANDAKGFPGLKEISPGTISSNVLTMSDTPDDTDFTKTVINAGGSASSTASSAYAVEFGELAVQLVFGSDNGGNGELFEFGERRIVPMAPDSTKPDELADHEVGQYAGHIGLSVAGFSPVQAGETVPSQYCLRRLMNLTNDADCGFDDYKAEKLIQSFPDGHVPSMLTMSHRSGDQWAKSRKSTGSVTFVANGASGRDGAVNRQPARPTEYQGLPVVYTRAIKNNDAIEVPA